MREQDIRIRIIAERVTQAAEQGLRELIGLEDQLRAKTDAQAEAWKNSSIKTKAATTEEIGIIQKLKNELDDLRKKRDSSNDTKAIKVYNEHIGSTSRLVDELEGKTSKTVGTFGSLATTLGAAFAADRLMSWGESLLTTENRLMAAQLAIRNVIGSQEDYEKSLSFLSETAEKYGQDLLILTNSYKGFIASSESSNLSLKERNRIFESVIQAGSALQMNNEQIEGSLVALSQMFSKGNVSAEELRGQLGERLPGAFGIMAKALNVSEKQLNKMLEQGQVLAKDALPLFATELQKAFGDKATANINTMSGALNLLKNKVTEGFSEFNKSVGITDAFVKGLRLLGDNLGNIVKVGGAAVSTFVAYEVITRLVAARKAALILIEKASLVVKGQAILATEAYIGMTIAETQAQVAATVAARNFNAVLAANPFGIAMLAVGALTTAYFAYTAAVDDAKQENEALMKDIASAKAPLEMQRLEFNSLSKEVLNSTMSYEQQMKALNGLKEQHPELLRGVTNLADAEAILNKNKIATNSTIDYRNDKLKTLIAKYPEQMKGVTTLAEAEAKLGTIIRLTNADFAVRARLLENEVRIKQNVAQAEKAIAEKILLESKLKNASTTNVFSGGMGGINNLGSDADMYKRQIAAQDLVVKNSLKNNDALVLSTEELTKKLNFEYGKQVQDIVTAGQGGNAAAKKASKEREKDKVESEEVLGLISAASNLKEQEKTKENLMVIASLEYEAELVKIKELKVSQDKKQQLVTKAQNKLNEELSKIDREWTEKEQKEAEGRRKSFSEGINAVLLGIEKEKGKKALEFLKKEYEEKQKLDKEYSEDAKDALDLKYKYEDKMMLLSKIAQAKSEAEITKIIKQAEEERIKLRLATAFRELTELNMRTNLLKNAYGEESIEYKKSRALLIEKQKEYHEASIEAAEFATDKQIEEIKRLEGAAKKSLKEHVKNVQEWYANLTTEQRDFIEMGIGLFSEFLDKQTNKLDEKIEATTSLYEKARLETQKNWLNVGQDALSTLDNLLNGNVVATIFGTFKVLSGAVDNWLMSNAREERARLEEEVKLLKKAGEEFMDRTKGYFSEEDLTSIKDFYASVLNSLEMPPLRLNIEGITSFDDVIKQEIAISEGIHKNYDTAVTRETEYFNLKKDNIQKAYNAEIETINSVYALKEQLANDVFNRETLLVKENLNTQLLEYITNESSKTSVIDEFAKKRSEILSATAMADMQITDGIDEATKNAIFAARELRDQELMRLAEWYTGELTFIIDNEEQKRKEYSATEQLIKEAEENIDLLRIQKAADDIERNKNKNVELLAANESLKLSLETAEKEFNDRIVGLGLERDAKLKESFELLTNSMAEGYKKVMDEALAAFNAGKITAEQYNEVVARLNQVRNMIDQINANPLVIPEFTFPIPNIPLGFADGTERVVGDGYPDGIDTVVARVNKGERIVSTQENNLLKAAFGRDISNNELLKQVLTMEHPIESMKKAALRVPILTLGDNQLQKMSTEYLLNMNIASLQNEIVSMKKEMEGMRSDFKKLPIENFTFDEKGFSRAVTTGNATTKYIQNKHRK